jgi:S-adenosylmethionine:tRNA ribosyltransferase-isomerase
VLNDAIPARLTGRRHRDSAQGPVVARSVTLLEPQAEASVWYAAGQTLRKLKNLVR